jgi:hypothetical protein
MYWREEGEKGASMESGRGTEMGQLTLGKRKARIGIHNYVQGATILIKGFPSTKITCNIMCYILKCLFSIKRKYSFLCR